MLILSCSQPTLCVPLHYILCLTQFDVRLASCKVIILANAALSPSSRCLRNHAVPGLNTSSAHMLFVPAGKALPQLLPDLRKDGKLPANLPASILSTEGATYNFYYRAVYTFYSWAPCATLHVPTAYPFPEGFELVKVIPLTEDLTPHNLSQAASIPMAAVLKQPNACGAGCDHLVVLIRGTRTKPEQVIGGLHAVLL